MEKQMHKKRNLIASLITLAVLTALLLVLDANKFSFGMAVSILQKAVIYSVVAVSMNLLNGFTGLFSLGQAGFMALGAYTTALLTIPVEDRAGVYYISGINPVLEKLWLPFPLALVAGGIVAGLFAALIGIPVLRLKSDYLAIATLGFSEIIRAVIASPGMDRITNGSYGLKMIPTFSHLIVPFAIAAVCILVMVLMLNSSYGRAFKAIREDEIAAEAMGINLFHTKLLSFVTSSFFAGIGGGMLAMYMSSIDSGTFKVNITYDILLIVVLGGMGSVTGSILGSFLVVASKDWWLRFFDDPLTIGGEQRILATTIDITALKRSEEILRKLSEIVGAAGLVRAGSAAAVLLGELEYELRASVTLTFGGGTNEIQRDIIGYVGLGLPAAKR